MVLPTVNASSTVSVGMAGRAAYGADCDVCNLIQTESALCPPTGQFEDRRRNAITVATGCMVAIGAATYVTACFLAPAFRRVCLPYLPATPRQLENLASLLAREVSADSASLSKVTTTVKGSYQPLARVVDLGSGDGRVVFDLARRAHMLGLTSLHGLELNRPLVWYSQWSAFWLRLKLRSGVNTPLPNIRFRCADIWKADLTAYDTVVLFGAENTMELMEAKAAAEMQPGSRLVTARFPLPTWTPTADVEDGFDSIYLYQVGVSDAYVKPDSGEAVAKAAGRASRAEQMRPASEPQDDDYPIVGVLMPRTDGLPAAA